MNVLSYFDGISCGQLALNRANIGYENYFASEIDGYALWVTKKHFTNTIQLGNCINVRILDETKPKHFFLENVVMSKKNRDIISSYLGVQPIKINSNLVSAQNRQRYYWSNIEGITQPEDRNIYFKDIIEIGAIDRNDLYLIDEQFWLGTDVERCVNDGINLVSFSEQRTEEAKRIRRESIAKYGKDFSPRRAKELIARKDGKINCLTTSCSRKEHTILDEQFNYRKLTPLEFERCQTLPDNYTKGLSDIQRYKVVGNGWTVDAIAHQLKNIA
jgi:site-specific DNA-cytosine methylase